MALPVLAIIAAAGLAAKAASETNNQKNAHTSNVEAQDSLKNVESIIADSKTDNSALVEQGLSNATSMWDPNGTITQDYQSALNGLNDLQGYQASVFDYDKSIQDFYDPAFKLSVNMANDAINNSQAVGGNMFSSDTANKLAAKNNVLATQMYNDARNAYAQDKSLEQSIWAGNESAKQAEANSASNIANAKLNAYGTSMSNLSNANQDYINNLIGINSDYASDMTDYAGAMANLKSSDPGTRSVIQNLLDPIGLFG